MSKPLSESSNKTRQLFDLHGKTALVTGGAGLLGAEFCRTLAEAGANVVVVDLNYEAAQGLAETLTNQGYSALAFGVDITDQGAVEKMTAQVLAVFGRLDILVNSAAMDPKFDPQNLAAQSANAGAFESFPLDAWKQALDVNLTGAFLCCQAAAKAMLVQGGGVIINIASMYGLVGPDQRLYERPDLPPGAPRSYKPVYYTVTKAGILGLTHYLAAYFAGKNIRVNALTPGGVFNGHQDQFVQAYSARSILGRMAQKDEMNGALLFLASDASTYMTGANLVVDGGWTAW
jgi:NAD(P)-dependent dehydrogenase (short-subunit alcohol dehydrogenase family)